MGRIVTLDKTGKVVTIVAYMVPLENFDDAEIIVNRTGVPMVRRGPAFRPAMT